MEESGRVCIVEDTSVARLELRDAREGMIVTKIAA